MFGTCDWLVHRVRVSNINFGWHVSSWYWSKEGYMPLDFVAYLGIGWAWGDIVESKVPHIDQPWVEFGCPGLVHTCFHVGRGLLVWCLGAFDMPLGTHCR